MVPGKANQRVIADRLDWVQRMTDEIRALPLDSLDAFTGDRRNIGVTAEELYAICTREIADLLAVRDAYLSWLKKHPECIDTAL